MLFTPGNSNCTWKKIATSVGQYIGHTKIEAELSTANHLQINWISTFWTFRKERFTYTQTKSVILVITLYYNFTLLILICYRLIC